MFELINVGLGPAVIDGFHLTIKGQALRGNGRDPLNEFLGECLGGRIKYELRRSSVPSPRYCIKTNEEYVVAEVFFPDLSADGENLVDEMLEVGNLDVAYSSFYGEQATFSTRSQTQILPAIESAKSIG